MTDTTLAPAPTPARTDDDLLEVLLRRIQERTARVLLVGQGYVGLPVAMRAVEVGFPVVGLEASPERAAALRSGTRTSPTCPTRAAGRSRRATGP